MLRRGTDGALRRWSRLPCPQRPIHARPIDPELLRDIRGALPDGDEADRKVRWVAKLIFGSSASTGTPNTSDKPLMA